MVNKYQVTCYTGMVKNPKLQLTVNPATSTLHLGTRLS